MKPVFVFRGQFSKGTRIRCRGWTHRWSTGFPASARDSACRTDAHSCHARAEHLPSEEEARSWRVGPLSTTWHWVRA